MYNSAASLSSPHEAHRPEHFHMQGLAPQGLEGLGQRPHFQPYPSTSPGEVKAFDRNYFNPRFHPYASDNGVSNAASLSSNQDANDTSPMAGSGPVRRRISRACDQCNQLRTKCDGNNPCAHCVELGLTCEYKRERKKRGKTSKRELHLQQQKQHQPNGPNGPNDEKSGGSLQNDQSSPSTTSPPTTSIPSGSKNIAEASAYEGPPNQTGHVGPSSGNTTNQVQHFDAQGNGPGNMGLGSAHDYGNDIQRDQHEPPIPTSYSGMLSDLRNSRTPSFVHGMSPLGMGSPSLDGFNAYDQQGPQNLDATNPITDPMILNGGAPQDMGNGMGYANNASQLRSPQSSRSHSDRQAQFDIGTPISGLTGSSKSHSPRWRSLKSPSGEFSRPTHSQRQLQNLRYPVLGPLVPYMKSILPLSLACDLLEEYFKSSTSAFMHPLSPYLVEFVFRREAFLHPTKWRPCSPALLASMLWVTAQTSDAPFLTSPPASRGRACQKLSQITVKLLNPLVHGPLGHEDPHNAAGAGVSAQNGSSFGGLGVVSHGSGGEGQMNEAGYVLGARGGVDDVATYMHLATVVSASEYKAASLRWWNAAWSLARELKLNREVPDQVDDGANAMHTDQFGEHNEDKAESPHVEEDQGSIEFSGDHSSVHSESFKPRTRDFVRMEGREERRRIWWLLFAMDRHLALCYNKPLALRDFECAGLLQPMDEVSWQSGEFPDDGERAGFSRRGAPIECTDHSIFGFFLPLMTILGEIFDLHQAQNRPRFEGGFRNAQECGAFASEIASHLHTYERSLRDFEQANMAIIEQEKNANRPQKSNPSVSMRFMQTKQAVSYGTHIMHVLHILLAGKWDPIALLDDHDLWISSPAFPIATRNAVSAAEAINEVLKYDPDLSFMPYFFGMYLLQGSFLLLVVADKLQDKASPAVIQACETIVRAHEACVVTLSTEYQRNFRKVMLSAIAQVRGFLPEDNGEQARRRRELLGLYRWTGDGTGLAL